MVLNWDFFGIYFLVVFYGWNSILVVVVVRLSVKNLFNGWIGRICIDFSSSLDF